MSERQSVPPLQRKASPFGKLSSNVLPQAATCARRSRRAQNGFCQKEERPKAGISAAIATLLAATQAPNLGRGRGAKGSSCLREEAADPPVPPRPSTRKKRK